MVVDVAKGLDRQLLPGLQVVLDSEVVDELEEGSLELQRLGLQRTRTTHFQLFSLEASPKR